MSRDVLQRLSDPALVALAVRGGSWPRSLLAASAIPDTWMGLIEKRDGRRRFAPAGDAPRVDDEDTITLVRNRPLTVPIDLPGAVSADGHAIDATCEILVRWTAREDDLAALARTLVASESSGELSLERLAGRVADAGGRAGLQTHLKSLDAAQLVHQDTRLAAIETLRAQLARFCFETGATVEQITRLKCSSRTLAAHETRRREAEDRIRRIKAREEVEQASLAATQRRLGELSGVFERIKSIASDHEDLRWHDLLPSLSPADRGRLLENLWRVTPDARLTQSICVVAGFECVWLDPRDPERIQRRVTLPGDLGGLRSVAFDADRDWLLVGAASGVWALKAADGSQAARFAVPGAPTPKTGFNSAAIVATRLAASHSHLGVWSWSIGASDADGRGAVTDAKCLLEPIGGVPKTVRCVTPASDGRLFFAADDCVYISGPSGEDLRSLAAVDDTIHALAVDQNDLYIGTADGKILMLAVNQPDDCWSVYRAATAVESLVVRRWNDLVELVAAAGPAGVISIFSEQNVISRLLENAAPLRRAWAGDDIVVGLNDRRDRLVVMHSDQPERRGREASLARALGNSIQDACLITSRVGT